jgi:hypothetical protein
MKTRQELFNAVALALIAQRGPSFEVGKGCMYRGPNGRKCAAGHLIPDEVYRPTMETISFSGLDTPVYDAMGVDDKDVLFVQRLQRAHDAPVLNSPGALSDASSDPFATPTDTEWFADWVAGMRRIASELGLSTAVFTDAGVI